MPPDTFIVVVLLVSFAWVPCYRRIQLPKYRWPRITVVVVVVVLVVVIVVVVVAVLDRILVTTFNTLIRRKKRICDLDIRSVPSDIFFSVVFASTCCFRHHFFFSFCFPAVSYCPASSPLRTYPYRPSPFIFQSSHTVRTRLSAL